MGHTKEGMNEGVCVLAHLFHIIPSCDVAFRSVLKVV